MEQNLLIGLDAGNACVKTSGCTKYSSGIKKAGNDIILGEGLHSLTVGDKGFVVGVKRDAFNPDHFADRKMYNKSLPGIKEEVMKAAALGLVDITQHINIDIATGTPITHFNDEVKLKMLDYFGGQCNFTCDGIELDISIENVKTARQGFAPFARNYKAFRNEKRVIVIDAGGGTIDVFMVINGVPVVESFFSVPYGTNFLISNINTRFEMLNRRNLQDSDICDIVSRKGNTGINITEEMKFAVNEEVAKWFNRGIFENDDLLGLGYDFFSKNEEWKIIWMGGGAQMLHDAILETTTVKTLTIMNEFANAQAFKDLYPRLK